LKMNWGGTMGMKILLRWIVGLTIISLSACVGNMTIGPMMLERVQTIALSNVVEPQYKIIGGIPTGSTGDDFHEAMTKQNLHLGADLRSAFADAVEKGGYRVLEPGANNADARLEVSFMGNFAFYLVHPPILLRPTEPGVIVDVRLVDWSSTTLFQRRYVYAVGTVDERLRPDPMYLIGGSMLFRPSPLEVPEQAAAGLRASVPLLAEALSSDLAKP
jgi:hypothetical protein